MDLALELGGRTVEELKGALSELELAQWLRYMSKKMLPSKRLEWYMAQVALTVSRGPLQNAEELRLKDFIFDLEDEEVDDEPDIEFMRRRLGWTPQQED